jgi:hypothetical protein
MAIGPASAGCPGRIVRAALRPGQSSAAIATGAPPPAAYYGLRTACGRRAASGTPEMDARVKWVLRSGVVGVGHGGGWWGRAAGAGATTTVTLRCAGRDRRTVSGRELPRTSVASWCRIEAFEDPPGGPHRAARPHRCGCWLGGDLLLVLVAGGRGRGRVVGGAQRLVGHRGPQEAGELAGDGDVGDRRLLAVIDEAAVAVVQADLGLPGALVGCRPGLAPPWGVAGRGTTSARCPCGSFSDAALPNPA